MNNTISFQIVDISSDDIPSESKNEKLFTITLYGIDQYNKRIICHVTRFSPYFYIKVPNKQIKKMYKFMFANKVLIRTSFWEDFKKLDNSIRITVGDIYYVVILVR